MKRLDWKTIASEAAIVVIFIIAAMMYFTPVLEGKVVYGGDNINGISAVRESWQYHENTGDYTWWNGSMFCGMPNYQIGGGRTMIEQILYYAYRFFHWGARNVLSIFLFYLIAFYLLLRTFKINRWISMAGAFATSLSSYFFVIIAATHNAKCISITWMTMVIIGFILIYRKQYGWGSILTMFFTLIGFFRHPQMSYYICMLIGILFFAELAIHWQEHRWKDFGIATCLFAASFIIGLGSGSASVFTNMEYAEQTMRGGHSDLEKSTDNQNKTKGLDLDYATAWSYGIDETMTLMIPDFEGAASGYNVGKDSELYKQLVKAGIDKNTAKQFCQSAPVYRGEKPFTSGPVYAGAIVCFLFILGLLIVKGPYKWALLAATLFSVFLAWGHNMMWLTEIFFKYFPMYNKFRAVESILIVAEITMPLLGFMALKTITDKQLDYKKLKRSLFVAGGITGGICLLVALFAGSIDVTSSYDNAWKHQLPDFAYNAILAQRTAMIQADAWRSLIFILLGFSLTFLYSYAVYQKGQAQGFWAKREIWFGFALTALVIADMWTVDKRFCNDDNFVSAKDREKQFAMLPYEKEILQDTTYYRVLNLSTNTFNEARTSYYLKHIGGYHAAKLRRYQDLIDQHISQEMPLLMQAIAESAGFQTPVDADKLFPVLNMLNMKYAIVPLQNRQAVPVENPYAMGNAWFVDDLLIVDNANRESDALNQIDLRHTAVLDKEFQEKAGTLHTENDEEAWIEVTKYTPPCIEYQSHSTKDKTVVFSEIYYPYGWKLYVDNQLIDHYRVNYMLRAANLPAGDHQIRFVFEPESVKKGNILSMICLTIMLLTMIGVVSFSIISKRKQNRQA